MLFASCLLHDGSYPLTLPRQGEEDGDAYGSEEDEDSEGEGEEDPENASLCKFPLK